MLDDLQHQYAAVAFLRRKLTKGSCSFPSGRVAFLDVSFTRVITKSYQIFMENPEDLDWSSQLSDYYFGILPKCERTNKEFGLDTDNVYVVLNIKNVHWIALNISVSPRIDMYDSITSLSCDDEIAEFVKPYVVLFPDLIKTFTSPAKQDGLSAVAEFKIRRHKDIPQNIQTGDCGVYAIKYIECLAFGAHMEIGLCDANIEDIRRKLATDMFAGTNH